jgi:choline dehydrogenase-like flavoprotein
MDRHFDVVIIGSDAGGGMLARQLAPSGKSILILERGTEGGSLRAVARAG